MSSALALSLVGTTANASTARPDDAAPGVRPEQAKPSAGAAATPQQVPLTTWALPTPDAGVPAASQGPTFGQGGIVSWNGALWFAEKDAYQIGRIDLAGNITEHRAPASMGEAPYGPFMMSPATSGIKVILAGLPFEGVAANVGPTGSFSAIRDFGIVPLAGIAADSSDGAWVTFEDGEGISHFDAAGNEEHYDAIRYDEGRLAIGADGSVWVSDGLAVLKRLNPQTERTVNFPIPASGGSTVSSMVGSGGRVWYAKFSKGSVFGPGATAGVIGSIGNGGDVVVNNLPIENLVPVGLTPASDGGVWFLGSFGRVIGRVSAGGVVSVAAVPTGHRMDSITVGPDGNVWYVDKTLNRVGVMRVADFDAAVGGSVPSPPVAPVGIVAPGRLAKPKAALKVRRGKVAVKVACPTDAAAGCAGKVLLRSKKGKPLTRVAGFSTAAGKSSSLRLRFSKKGLRSLPRRGTVKVNALLTGADGSTSKTSLRVKR